MGHHVIRHLVWRTGQARTQALPVQCGGFWVVPRPEVPPDLAALGRAVLCGDRRCTEDVLARLAALVPRPRAHLVRYHGVYAPNFPRRSLVVRAGDAPPGRRKRRAGVHGRSGSCDHGDPESSQGESSMAAPLTWAQRLKRVFGIEITLCPFCGGRLRVIAEVTDPAVLGRILAHVRREGLPRAPPLAKGS